MRSASRNPITRATNTVEAYGRAVDDLPLSCAAREVDPIVAGPDVVAAWNRRPAPAPQPGLDRPGIAHRPD